MAAPTSDSREDLAKWVAEREAQLNKWEAELKTRQQSLDLQEARIASKGRLCVKCQAVLDPSEPGSAASEARPPPLPRPRVATLQTKTMPLPIGVGSPTPPAPNSPSTSPRVLPMPAGGSMRMSRPTLSPTPALPSRGPPASASVRLPIRSPQPPVMAPSASTPAFASDISSEVSSFLAEHKKVVEVGLGSFPGCLLEGFMIKKGAKVKNWKRRYFVLQASGKLMYFENSDGRKLLGQLQVTSESSVGIRGNGGEDEGGLWVCPEPNGRIYEFESGDADTRDKWISALNSLLGPVNMPRQWKQPKPEKPEPKLPTDPAPAKVALVVQIPGSFFRDGEEQAMEVSIYPDETVAAVIQRSLKLVNFIPGLHKAKLLRPLNLANAQGEILGASQVVHPISVVVLKEL